jgi:hypothetical protein
MSTLIRQIRKSPQGKHPTADQLYQASSEPNGWLARFSAYRDLFIHHLPVSQATPGGFIWQTSHVLSTGEALPRVTLALPADPFSLKRVRSSGNQFNSMLEFFDAVKEGRNVNLAEAVDALDCCHTALGDFARLAMTVSGQSPAAPSALVINANEVIGPIIRSS